MLSPVVLRSARCRMRFGPLPRRLQSRTRQPTRCVPEACRFVCVCGRSWHVNDSWWTPPRPSSSPTIAGFCCRNRCSPAGAAETPRSVQVGAGLCSNDKGVGIRVYEGNGDNPGTTQERTDRCAAACFNKRTALAQGPWSSRGDAIGFGLTENNGRCYCQHETFTACKKVSTNCTCQTNDVANASHSKRSAALMCRNWQLSFGYVMKRSQVFCRAFCGPYQKEGVKLAEMTPTAHFERRLFCCALQTWRTSSSLRVQKLGPGCA